MEQVKRKTVRLDDVVESLIPTINEMIIKKIQVNKVKEKFDGYSQELVDQINELEGFYKELSVELEGKIIEEIKQ